MKLGIVLGSNNPEMVWKAINLGVSSLKAKHKVKLLLMSGGDELLDIKDPNYDVKEQLDLFIRNKGELVACETCLGEKPKDGIIVCGHVDMDNLRELIEETDKVITFY